MAIINIPGVGLREIPDNLSFEDKFRLRAQLQAEAGLDVKPQFGLGELFTRGVERGYERTKSTFGDVLPAMVASAFGADEYAKKQMEEARASQEELERRLPAMYKSYKDIGGVKDFFGYAAETLGEVAPDIATSLVPGGVGAVVGRGIATQAARQALTGAARQGLAREAAVGAAEKAAEKAASRGMLAGTYLGSYAQNAPEVFQSIYEETGSMNAPVAALYGGLSAALDSILPAKVLDQLGTAGKGALIRNLAEAQGAAPSVVKTIGKGVAKGMASEGLTESAQEFVNNLAVKTLKENYDLLSPENIDKYIDSFLRGAIAGGGVSLPTSAIEAARERSLARAQEQQKTAETAERQRVETEQLEQQQREQQKQQILQSIPQGVAPIEIGENIFTVEQTASATDQVPPAYVVAGAQFSREVKTLDEAEKLKASIESTKEQDIADYEKKVQSTQEKLVKLDEELEKKQRDTINVSPEEFSKFQNETYPQQREKLLQQLGQEETILQRLDQPVTIKPKIRPDAPTVARGTDEFTLFKHTPEGKEVVEKTASAEDAEAALDRVRQKEAPPAEPAVEPTAQPPEELGGTEVTAGPELDELKQELDRLGLPEVGLKLIDGLTGGGSPVDGAFGQQTIYVAMTPTGRTRKQALHHEFIHALKEAGLFTPSEWKALSAAAKSDWMKRKWPNLGNRTIPETYGDLDLEGQIEEAIAVAFEHYTQKQYTPAMKVASAFQKIKNFLARVKNYFTGKGYQTAEDVFDFVESGAMRYKVRPEQMGGTGAKYAKVNRNSGKSPENPIVTRDDAITYSERYPDAEARKGRCHELSVKEIIYNFRGNYEQILGVALTNPNTYVWHSVAVDKNTGNIFEPISGRWFTPEAMEAFGFQPVLRKSYEEVRRAAKESGFYPDETVYKPRGYDKKYLKKGDFDPEQGAGVKFAKSPPIDSGMFKLWFKDSVVKNRDGSPLKVYHGTSSVLDFTSFDTKDYGAWFAEEDALANLYSQSAAYRGPSDQGPARVIPAYLKIKMPFKIPDDVDLSRKITAREAFDRINDVNGGTDFSPSDIGIEDGLEQKAYRFFANPEFIALLRRNGYDGMSAKENGFATWNVFSPQQAKSATGNVGAYGQREVTREEAERVGLTPAQAKAAQKKGDIRFARTEDLSKIVNRIDLNATPEEKVQQLIALTNENVPFVKSLIEKIDKTFGTESKDNKKAPENILSKASRPSILEKKPWHNVEHIRDSYRFKTDLDSIQKLPGIIKMLEDSGIEIIKRDTDKLLAPGEWGWRIVAFDLRMPNGQLVEYYLPVAELETAKKAKGHLLFEEWRNHDIKNLSEEDKVKYEATLKESNDLYQAAWDDYLERTGESESAIRAALAKVSAVDESVLTKPSETSPPMVMPSGISDQLPSGPRTAVTPSPLTKAVNPLGSIQARETIVEPPSKTTITQGKTKYALSFPQAVTDARRDLKLKRLRLTTSGKAYPGAPKNERMVLSAPGRPDFVTGDITIDDWKNRVQSLLSEQEIRSFANWYSEVNDLFKQYFPKNDPSVDNYMAAWLVANQNTDVSTAMKNALLQAEQIGRRMPESQMRLGGLETATIAARSAIRGVPITEGVGIKISDFVDSALGKNTRTYYGDHAVGAAPFVVDIHTARDTGLVDPILINHLNRLGYNVPEDIKIDFPMGPGETQYENRADFGREMTRRLNAQRWMGKSDWKPAEIQAIGWMAMTRLTADAVEDTRTALERNLQRISMEAAPGDGSPLAEKYGEAFSQLPADKQADLTQTLTTMAINAAQQISGIKLSSIVHGMGGWQHFQNPATVAQALATPEGAEIASNVIGYLLQQTEVWSNKAKPLTKNPRGFAIDFLEAADGTTLATDAGILDFWNKVMEADPTKLFVGYQPIKTADNRHGIRVLVNKGGKQTSEKIFSAIEDNIKDMVVKSGLKLEVTGHEAEIIVARNDWTQDREGRAYLERLVDLGVADPAAKLDPLRSQFETVYKEGTGVRFARSPESQAGPSGSGHVVLGRTRKADAAEVKGVHYGNKLVDKLLGSMYGTGIRGAERQRLAKSTDERIKKRVYFYIEKPDGKMPPVESGLGAFVYTQNFGNILAPGDKMSDMFAKANRDFNDFESSVVNAGYDGYAVPSMGMMVILNHDVPVNYEGTRDKVKFAKAAQEGLPPNVLKAQAMERLNEVQPMAEPNGFNLARSPVTAKAGMNVLNQFVDEAPTFGKQVVQRILDMPKNNRAMVYKFLTLEQLADVGQNLLPELKDYYETFQDMTGYREKQIYYAQKIAERLAKLKNKSPEMVERLADVCNDATLLGFDPDPAKKAVGTSLPIMKLKGDWNKLNQEAKDLYVEMRNFYENRFNAYQAMLQDRIDKSVTDPASRQAIMEKFRKMFESARNKGPYFPLSRFGQYWVSFEQGGIKNFRMFETLADSQRFQKELDSQGVPHNQGVRGDTMIPDGIPASQIQEIIGLVDTAGNPGELKQQIWNTYISMLPEVSMRKHFLPRKGTPGYSNDILRSFSENTFHGAYALARLKYAPDFDAAIAAMKKREKDLSGEQDSEKRSELLREVESRQQYIDNPTDTNFFTNMAGTIGFTWFLTAPASAITNLAQNVTVAFPILSAKFGTTSAMREMSTAYKQFMASAKRGEESVFDIQRTLQQLYNETKSAKYKREMDAINALMDNGTLSRTQTMDLAQLSDKPSMVGTRFHSTMKYVGMLFHGAEVMNRTTTALSAFRLSYEKHKSLGEAEAYQRALKDAREITRKAHFDYSASNKPPIMQGKTARVIFMFKQYGQHMAYMLLRETQLYGKYLIDKYRGTPMQKEAEIRAKEARDTVIGILCTTGMFSGVFGLPYPLYVLTITIANALFGDDEDEEFDAETRFKLWLTDTLGAGPADIIAKGPLSYLTGADISDRISSNGLIFRDTGRLGPRQAKDEDQVAATQQFLVEMAGPMGGLAMNIGQGIESFKNGQVYRGIEKMVPAPLRDAMETYRYNTEGVLTMKGDPILDEVSSMQSFVNLIGFAPVELARQYEENAAIKAVESKANMERKRILNKFALATNNHDFDALEDVEAAIERYNERFPSYEITGKTLAKSLKSREAASAENEHGVRVTKKLAGIAERAGQLTGTE